MVTKIKVWRDFPVGWSVDENEREWIYRLSIFDAREEDSGVFSCTSPDHMTNSLQLEVQAVSCPSVVLSDPLLRIVSAGDSTLMNARLDFTCSPGFQLQGPPSIRCLHTGQL
ncbi:unnamed protein product [Cyprideis torosa]|uniref:Uncharacterized protein n=1 Tax=Cyprideis torosa TaxID=163714 RepID=A0A7R8ZUN3_9CRUS|nr:unnamed protein product [Cyprideis torosa]CAG0909814.1 unnamed protein product [Cyprideis torosa]